MKRAKAVVDDQTSRFLVEAEAVIDDSMSRAFVEEAVVEVVEWLWFGSE